MSVQLIAHRGGKGFGLENTLEAMRAAIESGVEMMETDVRCTLDNRLVVCHDAALWGRSVEKMTYGQLRMTNPERPLLDDVLELLKGRCRLNLEVKSAPETLVGRALRSHSIEYGTIVTSFNRLFLSRFKQMFPEVRIGYLFRSSYRFKRKIQRAVDISARYILPHFNSIDEEIIEGAHTEGLEVYAWTVNREEDLQRLIDMGIDGVVTDRYTRFRDYLS